MKERNAHHALMNGRPPLIIIPSDVMRGEHWMHSRFGASFKVVAFLTNVWFYEVEICANHYNRRYKAKVYTRDGADDNTGTIEEWTLAFNGNGESYTVRITFFITRRRCPWTTFSKVRQVILDSLRQIRIDRPSPG